MKSSHLKSFSRRDVKAAFLILIWMVAYFNVFRVDAVVEFARAVSLPYKLIAYALLLGVGGTVLKGIYERTFDTTVARRSPQWFLLLVAVSMIFAVASADVPVLFMSLTLSLYLFDRCLYGIIRWRFNRKKAK